MKIYRRLFIEAPQASSGADFSAAKEAARRMMKRVRPQKDRVATLRAIAQAVVAIPVLMDWFYRVRQRDGKVRYHPVSDVLGDAVMDWKEDHGIEDDDEFEELTADAALARLIDDAVKGHKPTGSRLSGVSWTEVEELYSALMGPVRTHDQKRALALAEQLAKALGAK